MQLFFSSGHGAWAGTGERAAAVTVAVLVADERGDAIGVAIVSSALTLSADGQTFRGTAAGTVTDAAGAVLNSFTSTVEGARITVQPLGTPPAGTPTT